MPAIDRCHTQIVHALQKDGWTVNAKPKYVYDVDTDSFIFIDIEAVKSGNGLGEGERRIYVEVKCFPGHHTSQELYIAFGQYLMYRAFLQHVNLNIPVYLAIPSIAYEFHFSLIIRKLCLENKIKLIVVNLEMERIEQWLEQM